MTLEDLPETIKKHLVKKLLRDKQYDDNRFGVTELSGCTRKLWFKRRSPEPITLGQAYIFNRGMLWDDEYTALFARNQVRVTHRIPNTDIVISGRIDFVDDDGAIADMKTIENLHYVRRDGAKDDNVRQVLFYCWCEGVDKARLYYCSMGDVEKIDVDASYEEQVTNLAALEELAVEAREILRREEPPAVDSEHGPGKGRAWECSYNKGDQTIKCEYYERCFGSCKKTMGVSV
jgi:hypothetical protein